MGKRGSGLRAVALLCFVASGATSLALEVAWTRMLTAVFGNTVLAASTVLTAYMLGLALGSVCLGRRADRIARPLRLYGLLEVGVGLYALLFPAIIGALAEFYAAVYGLTESTPAVLTVLRLLLSLAVLLPPTFLMGGTLPVLTRFLGSGHREPGREAGYLYGANTLGAVLGCLLAGFVLLQALGVRGTVAAAGLAAIAVGLLAVGVGARAGERLDAVEEAAPTLHTAAAPPGGKGGARRSRRGAEHRPQAAPAADPSPLHLRWVLLAFAVTGFCAMAYEVLWTRVLLFLLATSVYSFATMLASFLVGLALGSLLSSRLLVPRLRRPLLGLAVVEVLVGLTTMASVPLIARLPEVDAQLAPAITWGGQLRFVVLAFADAAVVMLAPTLLMGAAFPLITTECLNRSAAGLGGALGRAYAANTLGCVLGSLLAGFALLPMLGTHLSLLGVAALNLAVGGGLLWAGTRRAPAWRLALAAPAALAALAFALTPGDVFHAILNTYHYPSRISFVREHSTGTVTVHDLPNGDRLVAVDGVDVAGLDFMLRSTQKLQAYLPLLLHPNPQRVVQIGFGSGETARVGLQLGVRSYTVVEICPPVFEAARFFEEINQGSYRSPRLRKVITDGKNWARLDRGRYDVVMNDSIFPGSSGSSALYTVDHFRNCRARLAAGGLFSCWVPLDLRARETRMVLRSFQQVFPHTSMWVASNCLNKHGLILGSLSPLRIDLGRLRALMARPDIRRDLSAVAIKDVYDLLDCHMCDEASIRRMVAKTPTNTDDRPLLEFSCAVRIPWEMRLRQTLAMLTAYRAPLAPYVAGSPSERQELDRRYQATTHVFRAQVAQLAGSPRVRRRELDAALALSPGDPQVASCEEELSREIRDLQHAVEERPGSRELMLRLAGKLFVALRYVEAEPLYRVVVESSPPPPDNALTHLAEVQFGSGRPGEAEETLKRCLSAWPASAEAHDRLAGIYLKAGRLEDARDQIGRARRLEPHDPVYEGHQRRIADALARPSRASMP